MNSFSAYPSRWRRILLTAVAAGFVAVGLWLVGAFGPVPISSRYSHTSTVIAGWFCLIFFGFCFAAWIPKLFDTAEQLRIDTVGIRYPTWSDSKIPWNEIKAVTTWTYNGQKGIVLHLRDPSMFPGRGVAGLLAGANRMLTGGDVSISLSGTDRGFDEALTAIHRLRAATYDTSVG